MTGKISLCDSNIKNESKHEGIKSHKNSSNWYIERQNSIEK